MFATRGADENAIYGQQTAAATKPLNQGVKGLAPKTPAGKAVTKIPLNDENAAFKIGGKGKNAGLFGGDGKGAKVDKSAFVTPAGPRNRAPLGNKTTNAKAIALQSQEKGSTRASSPRLRRAKVKVQVDPLNAAGDDEEREIEYMPPRGVPLPDHPDDWPADREYPQFQGKNFTNGWWSLPEKDDEEDDLSDFEAKLKKLAERERKEAQMQKKAYVAKESQVLVQKRPIPESKPSALTSKHAASALASTGVSRNFAAPTLSTKSRAPSALTAKKPTSTALGPGNGRHTAAKVASNTTLGYSKGRAVSSNSRKPLSDLHRTPTADEGISRASPMKMPFGGGTTLDELLGLTSIGDNDDDTLVGAPPFLDDDDGSADDFQLGHVED